MSGKLDSLLEQARDLMRGESNPVASREALIETGKHILAALIRENLAKAKAARSAKGISDWTFKHERAGIPIKSADRLTYGNEKLKGILIWDLPAITTCPSCAECKGSCYAVKAQVRYPMTMAFRWTNLLLYLLDPVWTEKQILSQMINRSRGYESLRIHSSGDFFDQEYIDWWEGIVRYLRAQTPGPWKIYSYSKADARVDLSGLQTQGVNIVSSILPQGGINFTLHKGKKGVEEARILARQTNEAGARAIVCPATLRKGVKCGSKRWGGSCEWCVTNRHTIFVRH
jgi:hypothetical protein